MEKNVENTLTLKKDKSSIKKINSLILFIFIVGYGGLGVYQMGKNKLVTYTALAISILYIFSLLVSFLIKRISRNSKKKAPFIMQVENDELIYYPLTNNTISYQIFLKEVKDIHVLWWGNGTNKVVVEFLEQPKISSRTDGDKKNIVEKNKLSFERLDISYKDFNQFFNSMNDIAAFPVIFDKRWFIWKRLKYKIIESKFFYIFLNFLKLLTLYVIIALD